MTKVDQIIECEKRLLQAIQYADIHTLQALLHDSLVFNIPTGITITCLLYTSDAADDTPCVDLGGRRIIKKIFFKQKTAYEIRLSLVGSEMCIRDRLHAVPN